MKEVGIEGVMVQREELRLENEVLKGDMVTRRIAGELKMQRTESVTEGEGEGKTEEKVETGSAGDSVEVRLSRSMPKH